MKGYSNIISYFMTIGFIIIIVVGYFIFHKMNFSLLQQQEEQFYAESEFKIKNLQKRIIDTTRSFKIYAQLPSFKSIRFYSLTLNEHAVEENKRQLELFFFDIQKNNEYLQRIRFIDNDGNEIINVDRNAIHHSLSHVSLYKNVTNILNQDLQSNEFYVDVINNKMGKPKVFIWWVPVYVSTSTRLGYLAFNVDANLIGNEIVNVSEEGLNYVAITNAFDDLLQGEHQLISEPLPDNLQLQNGKWIISDELPLSGLNWKVNIIGNETIYTRDIKAIRYAVNFGFIPTAILILLVLFYMFRKKAESDKQIHHLAYYDSLTGLVNRHQFDNALKIALTENQEHHTQHALLYLDLDQFKIVNDTCGHIAGDKLLEDLASHLKQSVRDSDMLARLGGDEFALLLNACPEEMAINIANKILHTVSEFRFVWQDKYFTIGVSIGVVFINDPKESAGDILRKADLACYMAKELGRNRIHIFTDDDETLEERHGEMQWVERIKQAIEKDRFFLVAQRIVPLYDDSHSIQRYEILIRLNDHDNIIFPNAFIPAAERYGIMPNIDKWVVDKSFQVMKKLLKSSNEKNKKFVFSINISGLSLGDKTFFPFIKDKFSEYKIPSENICFEITETAAITNLAIAMDFIHNVKTLGCSLALDDFGSGLCSFSYLKTIPVDYLKIDGAFVTRMLENSLDMAIVVAIKEISLAIQSKVIAEFVATTEIKEKLQELGIDYAQGYAVAKPILITNLFELTEVKRRNEIAAGDINLS